MVAQQEPPPLSTQRLCSSPACPQSLPADSQCSYLPPLFPSFTPAKPALPTQAQAKGRGSFSRVQKAGFLLLLENRLRGHFQSIFQKQWQHGRQWLAYRLWRESGGCGSLAAKSCLTHTTSWTVAHQVPLSMGLFRQEHWSKLPFPSPGESSWPRCWTWVSCIAGGFFTADLPGKPERVRLGLNSLSLFSCVPWTPL